MDANGCMLITTFVTWEAGTLLSPIVWLVF